MGKYNISFVYENVILITTVEMDRDEAEHYAETVHIPDLLAEAGPLVEITTDEVRDW
tara:strand:- start:1539 stop:1709 length:171 start_codon:yes stop_codon:yes gene_type:complete